MTFETGQNPTGTISLLGLSGSLSTKAVIGVVDGRRVALETVCLYISSTFMCQRWTKISSGVLVVSFLVKKIYSRSLE